jgi:hypothetical protein
MADQSLGTPQLLLALQPGVLAMRGYWILFTEFYCPICAHADIYQHRVFDRPKPKTWQERHEIIEVACMGHFL